VKKEARKNRRGANRRKRKREEGEG